MSATIVFIHGMGGTGAHWDHYKGHFEERGYTCIAPTLRHHDADPQAEPIAELGRVSLLDYASDLEDMIRELDGPPIIIGHSMGGLLAQILTSRGLAQATIILTPAAPKGVVALTPSVIRSFWSGMTTWGFWRKPMRQTYGEAVYSMMQYLTEEERRKAYDETVPESGRAMAEIGFWLFDRHSAARVDPKAITTPLLVVGATDDKITPAAVVRKVWKRYRHVAEYKEFSGHAHWVLAERGWQEIAQYCAEWLESKAPAPAKSA